MKKQVYEVNSSGNLINVYVAAVENGIIVDNNLKKCIVTDPHGLFKPIWTGEKWVEGATTEEIDAIMHQPTALTNMMLLGQQMTERELESMQQGQQITDLELRLLNMEVGGVGRSDVI